MPKKNGGSKRISGATFHTGIGLGIMFQNTQTNNFKP